MAGLHDRDHACVAAFEAEFTISGRTSSRRRQFPPRASNPELPAYVSPLHLRQQFLQQRRLVVFLPDETKRQPHIHVHNREQRNSSGALPTRGFIEPREPDPALDKTQVRVAIWCP